MKAFGQLLASVHDLRPAVARSRTGEIAEFLDMLHLQLVGRVARRPGTCIEIGSGGIPIVVGATVSVEGAFDVAWTNSGGAICEVARLPIGNLRVDCGPNGRNLIRLRAVGPNITALVEGYRFGTPVGVTTLSFLRVKLGP